MTGLRKKWSARPDPTRGALLERFGQVVVCLEKARASASEDSMRGRLQDVVSELLTLRTKLETMPEHKLTVLTTLDHLAALADAVEALATAESESVRSECLVAARDSVVRIAGQFS